MTCGPAILAKPVRWYESLSAYGSNAQPVDATCNMNGRPLLVPVLILYASHALTRGAKPPAACICCASHYTALRFSAASCMYVCKQSMYVCRVHTVRRWHTDRRLPASKESALPHRYAGAPPAFDSLVSRSLAARNTLG